MFSSECLASQQLRNTGMKRCRREGKKICKRVWDQIGRTWRMTYGEEERDRRYKLEDEVEGEDLLPYVALQPEETVIIVA